jgi:predicted HicB family RNase H-like nuclease
MAQRSTPGTFSVPWNEDLRQRLATRAAGINKSVNDCVEEAVEPQRTRRSRRRRLVPGHLGLCR